jgi:hypothetical protein
VNNGSCQPGFQGCNFKVDACLTCGGAGRMAYNGEPSINSSDAAVVAEYKKSEKSVKGISPNNQMLVYFKYQYRIVSDWFPQPF